MYNRKLEDARHHYARAKRNEDEAHVRSNQTGRAADRQAYVEALREVYEAQEEIDAAQLAESPVDTDAEVPRD